MDGVAIIIPWGTSLSTEQVVEICDPLYHWQVGVMPVFNADSVEEVNLILNLYCYPGSVIIAHPELQERLGWLQADYTITEKSTIFGSLKVLTLPKVSEWERYKLEAILDRLEEVL